MSELFARYEINREPIWPVLSKIVVGSLAFHLLFGLAMNYVPVARAIFGVSRNALGIEIVDEDYERTIVKDDVTMLLAGGKFQYPDGYFAKEKNGLLPVTAPPPPVPLPAATPLPVAKLPTPLPLPKGNQDGTKDGSEIGGVPLPPLATPTPGAIAKNQPTPAPAPVATPTPNPKDEANKKLDEIAQQHNVPRPRRDQLNVRPFDNLWQRLNQEQTKRPIDWKANATLVLAGRRSADDRWQDLRLVNSSGDPVLIDFLKDFVAAGGDSGALRFLKGPSDFIISLKLDGQKFTARVEAVAPSPEEATRLAQVYSSMLFAARIAKKGDKEEVYFKNSNIRAEGTNLLITMNLKQEEAKTLVTEQLIAAAKKSSPPPATQTP